MYDNPWIHVVEDEVVTPDGRPGRYGVVELKSTAVFIVALTELDEVVLVVLDRHTTGGSAEIPAGGSDGQDLLAAARRELLEETGLVADQWREIGRMNALNGVCRAPEVVFLAEQLRPATGGDGAVTLEQGGSLVPGPAGRAEGISDVRRVPFGHVLQMIRRGEISDGESVAALMYAALALGRVQG